MKLISEEKLSELSGTEAFATDSEYSNVDERDHFEEALNELISNKESYLEHISQIDRYIAKNH